MLRPPAAGRALLAPASLPLLAARYGPAFLSAPSLCAAGGLRPCGAPAAEPHPPSRVDELRGKDDRRDGGAGSSSIIRL
ncbi:hypothetical protein GQ55_1G433900 [Panicum hallii var. hallii]|uniref:Uncharacterized protein n=1 Tax=Panicum hallii var. hallii TaxID=1504633 RepID=A0A2T7FDN5_9POAL|nr:hypothetical protein GQ55_1G433900 [Panicum hallii var. hallii]